MQTFVFDMDKQVPSLISDILSDFPQLDADALIRGTFAKGKHKELTDQELAKIVSMSAAELISKEEPEWTYVAARAYIIALYHEVARSRAYPFRLSRPYGSFLDLLEQLVEKGIYQKEMLTAYRLEDIMELEQEIDPEKDKLFTYLGIVTLAERYLARDYTGNLFELPQERFMIIAMHLMMQEPREKRLALVKEAYWALSHQYMTVATPTMANAGKARGGQLSSCFVDTVDDSLQGIYDSNTDIARLSKMGGGIGVYMGKVRARGSSIRGYENKSSGVIPWIRQLNNTAVSVDQLGTRNGSVAVYLDVWHKDILAFLDLKMNNGDERLRAHDIFTGVCIPDLFMEAVENREEFYLFDPHEVRNVMGFSLEDFYDEEPGQGSFRERYEACVRNASLSRVTVPAIEIMKRIMISQLETGTPFMFYRDTVNRANPNKHAGMIYSSNLCTEILENMSPTTVCEEVLQDGEIVIRKIPGDFVVCNLSSINLGRAVPANVLERLIPIQVRMLDNVIDVNQIDVLQAHYTNKKYRGIGLGAFGLHHLLAVNKIRWESEEAVRFNDRLFERINYLVIRASLELAKEKGAYPLFSGSEWENGEYFVRRRYDSPEWKELAKEVAVCGIRNGYLMAIAPTGSTSLIAGSTASVDPVFEPVAYEEKTTYKIANPAPDLSSRTLWYYKGAYHLDQHWSIKQAAARQRHLDQGQSINLYVRPDIHARDLLRLHMEAWKQGLKTTYYIRSRAIEIHQCEACT